MEESFDVWWVWLSFSRQPFLPSSMACSTLRPSQRRKTLRALKCGEKATDCADDDDDNDDDDCFPSYHSSVPVYPQ